MGNVTVVVGAQYGSEGKGAVAAFLSRDLRPSDVAIRVAGPNAGHTAYDAAGREWKLRAVPVAAVTNPRCQLHIAAGSEIDPHVLSAELDALDEAGHRATQRLSIHPSATMLLASHIAAEQEAGLVGRIGSTGKGIGAARSARIMRTAELAGNYYDPHLLSADGPFEIDDSNVIIEGTQGYGLGLHTTAYPQVTSSDCRAVDFLAMAGISPWHRDVDSLAVVLVARVYSIRVAGNSGPMEHETTWEALGLPEERTTVTHKVRRVGGFDLPLVQEAVEANGGWDNPQVTLALTMLDQRFSGVRDLTTWDQIVGQEIGGPEGAVAHVRELELQLGSRIEFVGTGPQTLVRVPR